jgi:membrane protein implicated in regulation of membrane protease activity
MLDTMDALFRYCLLQVPGLLFLLALIGLALHQGWIDAATAGLVVGLWVLKDAALYRFYRPSLEDGPRVATEVLVGQRGKVTRRLSPIGLVWVGGESWTARMPDNAMTEAGQQIRVVGASGLTLIVEFDDAPVADGGD